MQYSEKVLVIDQWSRFILWYSDIWSADNILWIRGDIQEGDDHERQSTEVLPEESRTKDDECSIIGLHVKLGLGLKLCKL